MPSAAYKELMDDPNQMALTIIELRSFAKAKADIEQASQAKKDPPSDAIHELVYDIRHEIVKEDRQQWTSLSPSKPA